MPCFKPLAAKQIVTGASGGRKSRIHFNLDGPGKLISLRCNNCKGCRIDRSKEWAVRCVHEAQMHEENSFITLTYSPENLARICPDGSLNVKHFQGFMKRLRKHYAPKKIRFFHCGEYGEKLSRPHYHALLFGLEFEDKTPWTIINGQQLYRSKILESKWTFGHSLIGSVTFESAAYVARYIMKKINGDMAHGHYGREFCEGQLTVQLQPEYITMSRRPGIGSTWFEKFGTDVFPDDFVVMRGRKFRTPRFYDKLYSLVDAPGLEAVKTKRIEHAKLHESDNTPERLAVRETCLEKKIERLIRPYEETQ